MRAHIRSGTSDGKRTRTSVDVWRRTGEAIGIGRSMHCVVRVEERWVQLMAVEGYPMDGESWVGNVSGVGRQVLIAQLRVMDLWEAAAMRVPGVEVAITAAVLAGVVVSLEISSTRGETPIVGLGVRNPVAGALNGALEERAAVHVEQVQVVLVVFLEVLGVECEN